MRYQSRQTLYIIPPERRELMGVKEEFGVMKCSVGSGANSDQLRWHTPLLQIYITESTCCPNQFFPGSRDTKPLTCPGSTQTYFFLAESHSL